MTERYTTQDENLSTLVDGELHGSEQQSAMARVLADSQARSAWHTYQVIGDVLRSEELSDASQDLRFLAKLEARLVLEPQSPVDTHVIQTSSPLPSNMKVQSANSPVFWRMLAGVACSALLAVMGVAIWSPVATPSDGQVATAHPSATPTLAQSAPLEVAVGPDGMIRDPRLDQLLSAHQQLGGHSALQMPSGFLRNATYEGAGR